jgi:hypothetical protein
MATISRPTLTIRLRPQAESTNVEVEVRYTVSFARFEINNGVIFREKCFIFGEDNSTPGLQNDDDILVTLLDASLRASATPVPRTLTGVFTRGQLNEDSSVGAFDELKSFVSLVS